MFLKILLLLVYFVGDIYGLVERPTNLPCKLSDEECILKATNWILNAIIQGIPDEDIPTLDPMYHEIIEGNLGYIHYKLIKSTLEGLKSCKANKLSIKSNYTTMEMELLCRRAHLRGEYEINGDLLGFPIKGEGRFNVDTTNFFCKFNAGAKFYMQNNNMYIKLEKEKFKCELLGDLDIDVRSLEDNKRKTSDTAQTMIRLAKENPKLFTSLVDNPVHKANGIKFVNNLNNRLSQIPITELIQANGIILAGKL